MSSTGLPRDPASTSNPAGLVLAVLCFAIVVAIVAADFFVMLVST
jgi:hypothetical protein